MQSPGFKLGLMLVSIIIWPTIAPTDLSAARNTVSKAGTPKWVSTKKGKSQAVPKPAVRVKAPGPAKTKTVPKGSAGSTAKSYSKPSAASAKGAIQSASPGPASRTSRAPTRKYSKSAARAAQKTVYKQQQPEPERIREIQQALSDHGYPLEVNGAWDASTMEALKKFQTDKKIENLSGKGKLDSMTLISLGLGPKHESPAGHTEQPRQTP